MAIDPARILRRMREAEESGRSVVGEDEAAAAVRTLAVVLEEPRRAGDVDVVPLVRAS